MGGIFFNIWFATQNTTQNTTHLKGGIFFNIWFLHSPILIALYLSL